jgi:hypothetical protein
MTDYIDPPTDERDDEPRMEEPRCGRCRELWDDCDCDIGYDIALEREIDLRGEDR